MAKIYKNQTALTLILDTGQTLTGSTVAIKYKKPSTATGSWTGSISSTSSQWIEYAIQSGDLDESGDWVFWAYVTLVGGTIVPGEPVTVTVYEEGL